MILFFIIKCGKEEVKRVSIERNLEMTSHCKNRDYDVDYNPNKEDWDHMVMVSGKEKSHAWPLRVN